MVRPGHAALGYDLAAVCFQGPDSELTRTENAQPGIFLVSWVAFELLKERLPSFPFHATAGLSLGEFTALTAAATLIGSAVLPFAAYVLFLVSYLGIDLLRAILALGGKSRESRAESRE